MEKVAIYASYKNENRDYIEFLLNQIKDWCYLKNYDYTIYLDKREKNLNNRSEFKKLKKDIENHKYSKIIIKDIRHITRNLHYSMDFLDFLERNNCKIESLNGEDLNTHLKIYKQIINNVKNKEELER